MDDLIEFVSCDTRSNGGCGEVQNFSPKLSKKKKQAERWKNQREDQRPQTD